MPLTAVELCSAALMKLGAQPIASLDDPSAEAAVARTLYPIVRDGCWSCIPGRSRSRPPS